MYMAPEHMLYHRSSTATDIWSLACTLLELFTEQDTWDIPTDADPRTYITNEMQSGHKPPCYMSLTETVQCFSYNANEGPKAIELIQKFN